METGILWVPALTVISSFVLLYVHASAASYTTHAQYRVFGFRASYPLLLRAGNEAMGCRDHPRILTKHRAG